MKQRFFSLLITAAMVATTCMYTAKAEGEQPDVLTDQQRNMIIANCVDLQATLNRIHQNDALARYDRGHLYRAIVDKLMSPLNQRIASNQLDGSNLVQISANYNTQYQLFCNAYGEYELALRGAMGIDCTKQPVMFYDALTDARKKRELVRENGLKLVTLAEQYKKQFSEFRGSRKPGVAP